MSIADWNPNAPNPSLDSLLHKPGAAEDKEPARVKKDRHPNQLSGRPLHRLATVRRQQGISLRNMARRLGVEPHVIDEQEKETTDLPLSELYKWQKVLDVPVADLLVDTDGPLSPPVLERARMVKLMKTAAAILEKAHTNSLRRMVTMLVEQLLEIMPELSDVSAWHTVGQRRTLDDYGRVVERQLPDDMLRRTSR